MEKEINVEAKNRKLVVFYKYVTRKDGNKFKKWLTADKTGKIYQVKFILEALSNCPQARAEICVNESNMKWTRKNPDFPVLTISKIESVTQIETAPEDFDVYFEEA